MNNKNIIAQKYAKAFLNLYEDQVSIQDLNGIRKLEFFFQNHKKVIYFLSIPNILPETKEKLLGELFKEFNLDVLLKPLIHLLSGSKRLFLIDDILKHIKLLYKEQKNIMAFNISSSHEISNQDLEIIKNFLAYKTRKTILSRYNIDKNLVAGIRLQSNTLLWEYSILKQCETLRKQFNIQEAR